MSGESEELTFTTSSYYSDQLLDGATQTVERYKEEADNIIKELKKLRKGGERYGR